MPAITRKQAEALGLNPKRSKYGVDTSERGKAARTYRGRLYDSRIEADYAEALDADPEVKWWLRQVGFDLGEDHRYHADFLVCRVVGGVRFQTQIEAVDVKGAEPKGWSKTKKLWAKYAPIPLHVVRKGETVEIIQPAGGYLGDDTP